MPETKTSPNYGVALLKLETQGDIKDCDPQATTIQPALLIWVSKTDLATFKDAYSAGFLSPDVSSSSTNPDLPLDHQDWLEGDTTINIDTDITINTDTTVRGFEFCELEGVIDDDTMVQDGPTVLSVRGDSLGPSMGGIRSTGSEGGNCDRPRTHHCTDLALLAGVLYSQAADDQSITSQSSTTTQSSYSTFPTTAGQDMTPDNIFQYHLDPFYAEFRAFGLLVEKRVDHKLAVRCHGYTFLPPKIEHKIQKDFGFNDWGRQPKNNEHQLRAIVKDYISSESYHGKIKLSAIESNLKELNSLGIFKTSVLTQKRNHQNSTSCPSIRLNSKKELRTTTTEIGFCTSLAPLAPANTVAALQQSSCRRPSYSGNDICLTGDVLLLVLMVGMTLKYGWVAGLDQQSDLGLETWVLRLEETGNQRSGLM
ncbi:hypothetical protein FHL15_002318 [Xylaria flabelliformis]|uniref:Uncharacterized protein n=1 Tax=Xylaria flabelliformis TaxID=2512241 RepID=A0A553I9Z9_9PEZI|nr:hypothetical protein FHL15_002318 [Xylaria flabelliformis]